MMGRCTTELPAEGKLIKVDNVAKPNIVGGRFMTYIVGGALGALWEPIAPKLSRKLPVFSVGYSFDIDGKKMRASEVFFIGRQRLRCR